MKHDERYERAVATRRKVSGEERLQESLKGISEFEEDYRQLGMFGLIWGEIWPRPGLDLKTRNIVTVTVLAALGRSSALRGHILDALNCGVTREELKEILIQAAPYAGFAVISEAFAVAKQALEEYAKRTSSAR